MESHTGFQLCTFLSRRHHNNPFAASKPQCVGKTSVNLPTDNWLCKKFDRVNLNLVESYPSKSSDAVELQCDQFIKTARSQNKWYGVHSDKETVANKVTWYNELACLNSSYSWIVRSSGCKLLPAFRPISRETEEVGERGKRVHATYVIRLLG